MRVTKSDLKGMFKRLVRAMGKLEDAGEWKGVVLDYAPIYGGYLIKELCPLTGWSHPFGSTRRTAREMYYSMSMTAQALEDLRFKQAIEKALEAIQKEGGE